MAKILVGRVLNSSTDSVTVVQGTSPWVTDVIDRVARVLGHVIVDSSALPAGAATEATLATRATEGTLSTRASEATLLTRAGEHVTAVSPHAARLSDGAAFYKATTPADTQPISAAILPLPAGAATEATLLTRLADATFTARINTLGQKTMALSTPVVIASDQSAVPTSQSGAWTVTANQGLQGSHGQRWMVGLSDGAGFISPATDRTTAAGPFSVRLSDGAAFYNGATTLQFPAALVGGRLDTNNGAWLGSTAPTVGQKASASSVPVVIASDQSAVAVSGTVTANIGTTGGLALDATLTGGTTRAINRGGAKGATAAADVTSTAEGADHQALDVQIYHGGVAKDPTQIRSLTSTDVVTANQGVAAASTAPWATRLSDGTSFYDSTKTGQLPAALLGGRLDINEGSWFGSTAPTVGQKASVSSIPVVVAIDQSRLGISTEVQADYDTGVGSQTLSMMGLALPASGGAVAGGTATNPVRTDPTGTTTQPVSGTVTANQGLQGTHAQRWMTGLSDGVGFISPATDRATAAAPFSVRLSDGAAFYDSTKTGQLPAALVGGRLDVNEGAWLGSTAPTVGQKAMASSLPVAIASDQSTLTTTNASIGVNAAAIPTSSTQMGGSDGTNLQAARVFDADTGGGTQYVLGASLRKSASGGSVELGTSTDPIRTDPTGTTIQPVSGTVTANQGTAAAVAGAWPVKLTDGTNTTAVKAASTAAVVGDPSAVVALSPNSPVPAGTNLIGTVLAQQISTPTKKTYAASTNGTVASATANGTVTSIAYLFHPSANTKRIEILRIWVSWGANGGNNPWFMDGAFITAENGAPGGTSQTTNPLDRDDAASTVVFRTAATGAPTRVTGDLISFMGIGGSAAQERMEVWNAHVIGKPIVLRASVAEGFELRHVVGSSNLASAVNISVYYVWTEE